MMKLLTVILLTYNHEKTIAKAFESILEQQTNFEFEIFVLEDCSTDKTADICRQYKQRYPNKIRLFLNEKNLGVTKNLKEGLLKIKTKYFAFLEGDDYWCNKYKLQKQVDALEKNPECMICGHNTLFKDMVNNKETPGKNAKSKTTSDPELVFFDRLSSKKEEVKKKWTPKKENRKVKEEPPGSKKNSPRHVKGEKEIQRSSDNVTRPDPAGDGFHFTVQIASLADGDQAEKMIKQLNRRGYPAYFYEVRIDGKMFYRVRCGKFANRTEAKKYAEKLVIEEGIKGFVSKLE